MKVFANDEQFKNEAIVFVSRLVFDTAVTVISSGVCADDSERMLSYLLDLAKAERIELKHQNAISFYLDSVIEHNQEILRNY